MKYTTKQMTIREFRDSMYHKTECFPVHQRLPIKDNDKQKAIGIVKTIFDGYSIGTITLARLIEDEANNNKEAV